MAHCAFPPSEEVINVQPPIEVQCPQSKEEGPVAMIYGVSDEFQDMRV